MSGVALLIGADEGLGPAIADRLCERFNGKVYVTARDENVRRLTKQRAHFQQLDITSVDSIVRLRTHLQDAEEQLDLIINNSATAEAYGGNSSEQIRRALDDHFYGNLNLAKLIYPLLSECARVVTVTSSRGLLSTLPGDDVRRRLSDPNLTEEDLVRVVQDYEEAGRRGNERLVGWGSRPTDVGKVVLSALTFIHQRDLIDSGVSAVCVNPGAVVTRQGKATEEAVATVLYVALDAGEVGGKFIWSDRREVNWSTFIETHL